MSLIHYRRSLWLR